MRKFLTKAKIQSLILCVVFIILITIAGNVSLAVNKDTINKNVNGYFTHDIFVDSIFYAFPNRVVVRDIVISKTDPAHIRSSFNLPKMTVHFSLWDFLFRGIVRISDVRLYSSEVSYYSLSEFLEDNFQEILEIIRNSPGNDIKIRVDETLLDFDRKGTPDYVTMEVRLVVQGDSIEGTGLFRTDQYRFPEFIEGKMRIIEKGWPLWYKFKGQLKPDGLAIDHLIFNSGNLYSRLRGSMRSGLLSVNGFMFMDTTKQGPSETEHTLPSYFKEFPTDNKMANIDVYLLDIDGIVTLTYPEIKIDRFNFNVNNIPVTLKGSVTLVDPLTMDADLTFHRPTSGTQKDALFEKGNVRLSGTWKDNVLTTKGQMGIDFIKQGGLNFSPEMAEMTFADLAFHFDTPQRTVIHLANGDIAYWTNDNKHKVSIRDFKAVSNTEKEGLKSVKIDTPFYDGLLNGQMWIDSTRTPSKITSEFLLTDIDTDALEELLIHFAKFNGRMSAKMNFTNVPQMDLSGGITIHDGQLTDFNFFNWVGDAFRLPALKAIDFERATAQFSINKDQIQLHDIRLKTDDVHISGYFDVDNENLVSSKLTINLSQEFLRTSSKFRPILKMFKDDRSHLNFDFQQSGNLEAMNFQWLPSEVKSKIQTRIPDFIERKIERNVDAMMDPDPKEAK